ncbi:MAG: hypothetical protein ABI843_02400 [Dokdonella sp.]
MNLELTTWILIVLGEAAAPLTAFEIGRRVQPPVDAHDVGDKLTPLIRIDQVERVFPTDGMPSDGIRRYRLGSDVVAPKRPALPLPPPPPEPEENAATTAEEGFQRKYTFRPGFVRPSAWVLAEQRRNTVLAVIERHADPVTRAQIAIECPDIVPPHTIIDALMKLKRAGLIERVGSRQKGCWKATRVRLPSTSQADVSSQPAPDETASTALVSSDARAPESRSSPSDSRASEIYTNGASA